MATTTEFVSGLLQNLFGAEYLAANQALQNKYIGLIDLGGATQAEVAEQVLASAEGQTAQQVARLYDAYFNRIPDFEGLQYWVDLAVNKGWSVADLGTVMADSAEYIATYDGMTNEQIVDAIYQNTLGRAADAEGKAYWLAQLDAGTPVGAMSSAVTLSPEYVTTSQHTIDTVLAYQGVAGRAATQTEVETAAGVSTETLLDNLVQTGGEGTAPGQTFTLTTGADAPVGTAGNDTFVATEASLSSADVLDGGAGTDTLRYASSGAVAVNEAGFEASNIETVQVTSDATGGTAFDVTGVTELQTLRNFNSSEGLNLVGMDRLVAVELQSVGSAGALANDPTPDTALIFNAAVVAGNADALSVKLNGNLNVDGSGVGDLNVAGIEIVNVTTEGAASIMNSIASGSLRAMTIAGDQNLTLAAANFFDAVNVNTVNASAFTGNLNLTLTNDNAATIDVAVTGGTGNDTVTFQSFDTNDAFNGGDGIDTIGLTNAVATARTPVNGGTLSNVEQLNVTTLGTGTIDMDAFPGVTKVIYDAGLTNAALSTVADAASGITVEVDTLAGGTGNLTVALKTDGTADEVTIELDGIAAGHSVGTLTAADAETLNISADDDTVAGNGAVTIANLALTDTTALNLSGDADLTIAAATNPATPVLATVNASAATGNLNITGLNTAAAGATITLGSGDDVFNVATSNGADTITLGAGRDTIVYNALAQSDRDMDTITDFVSGTDIVDVRALMGGVGVASSVQFAGNRATFSQSQGALTAGGQRDAVFQVDEQILWVDVNGDGTLDNRDFRVKLDGVTGLTARDLGFGVGNTITLTAPGAVVNLTTKTNADNFSTVEDDTFNSTVANLAGSNLDGKGGNDVLNITDDLAGANLAGVTVASIERVNLLGGASAGSTMFNGATKIVSSAATNLTLGTGGQTYVGGDWVDTITDNTGNDRIETFGGNDVISIAFGGNDYVDAGAGNDTINAGTKLTTGDTIIGGAGTDTLNITNSNAANDLDNVSGIETINYTLTAATTHTTVDDLVAAGEVLNVNIAAVATNKLTFNGAAETDGRFVFTDAGTARNHVITGGSGNDVFNFAANTGKLNLTGGNGDDTFNLGAKLTAADTIAGGAGNDTLTFSATGAATDLDGVTGVETIQYTGGAIGTALKSADGVIAAGATVTFDATLATGAAQFDFSNETDGSLIYKASGNGDTVKVANNQLSDTYILGAGADKVDITMGKNTIANIANVDTIENFTAGVDKIDAINAGAGVFSVTLNTTTAGTFLGDVNSALTGLGLAYTGAAALGDAIIVSVTGGAMAGTYVISDTTAAAFIDATAEVVKLVGLTGTFTAADFV